MNCQNCGREINENQKFCTNCGAKIKPETDIQILQTQKISKKPTYLLLVVIVILVSVMCLMFFNHQKGQHQTTANNTIQVPENTKKTPTEILNIIDEYQAKYFRLIKQNDALLMVYPDDDKEKDRRELESLFKEVENKIDKNNYYFQKYKSIEAEFNTNTGENTVDMNEFVANKYNAVDKLLNEVYQEVKKQIPQEDFKNLTSSEIKWLKEVEAYQEVFDAQGFGSMGTLIYYDYEINMRDFRTLLLMLYL